MKYFLRFCIALIGLFYLSYSTPLFAQSRAGELLRNGTFEGGGGPDGKGGGVPEWAPFGQGYEIDHLTHRGGDQSIRCESPNLNGQHGAQLKIELNQKQAVPVIVSGWSKADQVQGANAADYSIYIDAEYMDGTPSWGNIASFRAGTHDWQRRQVTLLPTKPLKSMTIIALFRSHSGTVWFDDFSAHMLEGSRNFDGQPLTVPAFASAVGPKLPLATRDGLSLAVDARGGLTINKLNGQPISNANGGFYIRDVGKDGPLIPIHGISQRAKLGGVNIGANVPDIRITFNAKLIAQGDSISVDGEMTDLTKTDRAISVYLALPVNALGWQWGNDIRHLQTIESAQEYTHQTHVTVGATGGLSLYPYASIANAQGGIGIASQMDWPSVYRIFYNGATKQFVIGWDFALTSKTAAWPSRNARFRCTLFTIPAGPPEWSFRQATRRFYGLNQPAFTRRAKLDGLWLPFTAPDTIQNLADFGFAYHEGDNSIKSDNSLGILSFRYTEPMTYWLPMPPSMPRTYENALALIEKNASLPMEAPAAKPKDKQNEKDKVLDSSSGNGQPSPRQMAQAVLNSGTQDPFGHYNLEFQDTPWANGAVFVLNPNPELSATPEKPTKASVTYTLTSGMQTYDQTSAANKARGHLDGEYLDSLEGWADTQDFRPSHLQTCPYPIPFDVNDRLPVVPQWYATHTFTRFISQDLHNRNKLLMANSVPVRFAIYAALLDMMGIEVNWLAADGTWQPDNDETFNFRRTMSAQKPYLLLMNSDYDKFTSPMVEKYFQRSLFYGVFPSMFSANAADHPYWQTPRWYNRDRELFKKYIPIIKRLSAAGWETIPCAHVAGNATGANIYIERYGTRLFTVLNDGQQASEATLTIDLRSINLQAGVVKATNLITNADLPIKRSGSSIILTCHLNPEEATAIELK